jgi:hypothetical protein
MSYPINYPTPQGANVQVFTANTNAAADGFSATWVKPQGASMVWFTLIGAGGDGGNATSDVGGTAGGGGGGSGAVTNCMVPAFLIPDTLAVRVYSGIGSPPATEIFYQNKTGTGYSLLVANSGNGGGNATATATAGQYGTAGAAGTASTANAFSTAGFFQSVAGQAGAAGNGDITTSTTTFLQGAPGGAGVTAASQYGYTRDGTSLNVPGYSVMSPILVSVATGPSGAASNGPETVRTGFGSGGGGGYTTTAGQTRYGTMGGNGLVVIITW